ncbi:hypothetical protein Bca101_096037 [Brassica carinata]
MINHHQRVVLNSPCDCPQNCLFAAFTPLLILDGAIRLSLSFSLVFFVFQGVEGSPGVPAKARTCLPFIEEGVVTFGGYFLTIPSVSILAIDLINGPDHTLSPLAVTTRPGTANPLLDKAKQGPD